MAQAVSISLSKFTKSVQAAVKAASAKHPKLKIEAPSGVTVSYLIRGIPVPDTLLTNVTMGEVQGYANEVAGQVAAAHPEVLAAARPAAAGAAEGAVLSVGRHVIIGIPPVAQTFRLEE